MTTLKKGDKVKIVNERGHHFKIGEVVEYVDDDKFKRNEVRELEQFLTPKNYELIEEEVKFKVGDKVELRVTKPTSNYYSLTEEMLRCNTPMTIDRIGTNYDGTELLIEVKENCYNYHPSWLKLYDDKELEDNEMEELKVGDIVKVVDLNSGHQFKIGELVELIGLERDGQHRFKSTTRDERWFMRSSEYEKVDESEMGDEVGDKFVVISDKARNFDIGEVVELIELENHDGVHLYRRVSDVGNSAYLFSENVVKIKNYEDLINSKASEEPVDSSVADDIIKPMIDLRDSLINGGFTKEESLAILLKSMEVSK